MSFRRRYGFRRYSANFWEHNGNIGPDGQPTYSTSADWSPVVRGWPCELVAASGGETLRGRQVAAEATHVLFGEFFGSQGVKATHRAEIAGTYYNVVAALDKDGTQMERRVEVKAETG